MVDKRRNNPESKELQRALNEIRHYCGSHYCEECLLANDDCTCILDGKPYNWPDIELED